MVSTGFQAAGSADSSHGIDNPHQRVVFHFFTGDQPIGEPFDCFHFGGFQVCSAEFKGREFIDLRLFDGDDGSLNGFPGIRFRPSISQG